MFLKVALAYLFHQIIPLWRFQMTAAEDKVKRLAKLKCNTICPNCGTEKKFGFATVCIKFFTFVCNECKSSHQAISHRCKSITMSSWTDDEVSELERKGNDYCLRTWLKNAPPCGINGRPQSGSELSVYKRFVVDVYENKRYFSPDGELATSATSATPSYVAKESRNHSKLINPLTKRIEPSSIKAHISQVPEQLDLLDFSNAKESIPISTSSILFGDSQKISTTPSVSNSLDLPSRKSPPNAAIQGDIFSSSFQNHNTSKSETMSSDNMFGDFVSAPPSSVMASGLAIQNDNSQYISTPSTTGYLMSAKLPPTMPSSNLHDLQGLVMNSPDLSGLSDLNSSAENLTAKKPIMGTNCRGNAISMMTALPTSESKSNHFSAMSMNQQSGMSGFYSHGVLSHQGYPSFTMQQQLPTNYMVGHTTNMNANSMGTNQSHFMTFGSNIAAMNHLGPGQVSLMSSENQNSRINSKTDSMPGGNIMELWSKSQKKH
jgi:hypothetical protein